MAGVGASRWSEGRGTRGEGYDARFERLAAAGHDIHGEASFVMSYGVRSVLDAGCGTGRVAIELARRGVSVVGVDLDAEMLRVARTKAPELEWYLTDLTELDLTASRDGGPRRFDAVVAAGNVMIFLRPGSQSAAVDRMALHLLPGGLLIAGFQLSVGRYGLDAYDADCEAAGLDLFERWSTWTRDPWSVDSGYAVSVHRRALDPADSTSPSP